MRNSFFLILWLIIIFGSVFLFFQRPATRENQIKIIKINDISVKVEVADTSETRIKGLSGRKIMPTDTGMLFVFESSESYGFWMKDMNFAIDIVWVDEDLYIIGIEKRVLPETFPQVFYPKSLAKCVLELPAGFADKYRIDTGQYVTI